MGTPGGEGVDGLDDADIPVILPLVQGALVPHPVGDGVGGLPPQGPQHPLVRLEKGEVGLRVPLLRWGGLPMDTCRAAVLPPGRG